jgi:hypothetical protein
MSGKNRPETLFTGREMQVWRWSNMRSKVSNRNGTFVDIEGVTGVLLAPFVSNRKAGRPVVSGDLKEGTLRKPEGVATVNCRKPEWEKVMRVCEAP